MGIAARLPFAAWRNELRVWTMRFVGLDLTGKTLRMQVRLAPDTPGAPLIALETVNSAAAEGLKFESVAMVSGVPVSTISGRLNKSTMSDAAKLPYSGEVGENSVLAYAIQIDGTTRVFGTFTALASVMDSDTAPSNRPPSYGSSSTSSSTWSNAQLTFSDDSIVAAIDGAELLAPVVLRAEDAASAALIYSDLAAGHAAASDADADRSESAAEASEGFAALSDFAADQSLAAQAAILAALASPGGPVTVNYVPQPTSPPIATIPPGLTGNRDVGDTLSATAALWTQPVVRTAYQWERIEPNTGREIPIVGATHSSYTVGYDDVGFYLRRRDMGITAAGLTGTTQTAPTVAVTASWEPTSLFSGGDTGDIFDPSDATTLFSDTAGTTPAAIDGTVGNFAGKRGQHFFAQSTSGFRPTRKSAGGVSYLRFADPTKRMYADAPLLPATTDVTLVLAARLTGTDDTDIFSQFTSGATGRVEIYGNQSNTGRVRTFLHGSTTGAGTGHTGAVLDFNPGNQRFFAQTLRLTNTPDGSTLRMDGRQIDTFTRPPSIQQIASVIGRNLACDGLDLGRMIVIGKELTESQCKNAERWVMRGVASESILGYLSGITIPGGGQTITIDSLSGMTTHANGRDAARPVASMSKMCNALVMNDWVTNWNDQITITAPDKIGGSGNNVNPDDTLSYADALRNMIVESSNVTAEAISRHVGQLILTAEGATGVPRTRFISAMNQKAASLGLKNSIYMNPSGFDNGDNKVSVYDIAMTAKAYRQIPRLVEAWSTESGTIAVGGPNARTVNIFTTNEVLEDPDILGGKGGSSGTAGFCQCVHWIDRKGYEMYSVTLFSATDQQRFLDIRAQMNLFEQDYTRTAAGWPIRL